MKDSSTLAKWVYAGISGVCVAYLLALFSAGDNIENSTALWLATLCISIALPLFLSFSFAHTYILDKYDDYHESKIEEVFNSTYISNITNFAIAVLVAGFFFLLWHFSFTFAIAALFSGYYAYTQLRRTIDLLNN
ncbi:hypothetical protein A1QI_16585 [Vibrio genomosp. F10 str. 9ZB36]|nr:hypothetical protein A1QI_16585 [Vibrio genomosp. F10 str. 9ZB36]